MNINLTLIGQLLSFVVFVWFTMKYVWTPIMGALEERRKKIADGLAAGERGQHEQELAQERAKATAKSQCALLQIMVGVAATAGTARAYTRAREHAPSP